MKRRVAWVLILIVDAGYVLWGAMAAAFPDQLLGPGGTSLTLGTHPTARVHHAFWWPDSNSRSRQSDFQTGLRIEI